MKMKKILERRILKWSMNDLWHEKTIKGDFIFLSIGLFSYYYYYYIYFLIPKVFDI